jgi:hypothetical protein
MAKSEKQSSLLLSKIYSKNPLAYLSTYQKSRLILDGPRGQLVYRGEGGCCPVRRS